MKKKIDRHNLIRCFHFILYTHEICMQTNEKKIGKPAKSFNPISKRYMNDIDSALFETRAFFLIYFVSDCHNSPRKFFSSIPSISLLKLVKFLLLFFFEKKPAHKSQTRHKIRSLQNGNKTTSCCSRKNNKIYTSKKS